MKQLATNEPSVSIKGICSSKRIKHLRSISNFNLPEEFDPDEISWVSPRVAVTDWEGGVNAYKSGEFVICVAEEFRDTGHVYIPLDPTRPTEHVTDTLERITKLIQWVLSNSTKGVVIHSALGMERSVLAAAWYLRKDLGMTMGEAYAAIGEVRPIAVDRRDWVGE